MQDIVRGHPEIHLGIKMVPVASGLQCELQTLGLLSVRLRLGIIRAVRTPSAEGELIVKLFGQPSRRVNIPGAICCGRLERKHDPDAVRWEKAGCGQCTIGPLQSLSIAPNQDIAEGHIPIQIFDIGTKRTELDRLIE